MIAIVSAPTSLGLRPPAPGVLPGAAQAPEALRRAGLMTRLGRLGSREETVVLPGEYVDDDDDRPAGHVRNEVALVDFSRKLAERILDIVDAGDAPLVIGGDCSVLLGAGLAMARLAGPGLVHVDGHTDFRHPGNSDACGSVAGEDLAAAVGLHWPAIADIDGAGPYFAASRSVHVGHRDDDENADEARRALGLVVPASLLRKDPDIVGRMKAIAQPGYWLQVDVDVLDPSIMPAVDSPSPDGLTTPELVGLLLELAPSACGASVTVFDPDRDPDGRYAEVVADVVVAGLTALAADL